MTAKLVFFIFPVLLVLLPVLLYKRYSPFMVKIWLRMIYDPSTRKMAANALAMILIFFHPAYYAVFPQDRGIMLSLPIVFFLFFTKLSVKTLMTIRRNRYLRWSMTLACLIMPFIPHLLPMAISMAFALEFSYFYPADGMEKFYEEHTGEDDVDKKFIETYFK